MVVEKLAYATEPGDLNLKDSVGKRFWRNVREVLNLMEAVRKVCCSDGRGFPQISCRGPGAGPKATGMRQYTLGFLFRRHLVKIFVELSYSSKPKLYAVYFITVKVSLACTRSAWIPTVYGGLAIYKVLPSLARVLLDIVGSFISDLFVQLQPFRNFFWCGTERQYNR